MKNCQGIMNYFFTPLFVMSSFGRWCIRNLVVFAIVIYPAFACEINLNMLKHQQNESNSTCHEVEIPGDMILFKGDVNYQLECDVRNVQIQIKKKGNEKYELHHTFIIAKDCTNSKDDEYTSCRHTSENVVNFTIKFIASKELSGARIRAYIKSGGIHESSSHGELFPEIKSLSDAHFSVKNDSTDIFNGTNQCHTLNTSSILNLKITCQSDVLKCVIELQTNELTRKGTESLTYYTVVKERYLNMTINFTSCSGKQNITNYYCFSNEVLKQPEESSHLLASVLSPIMAVLVLSGIILLVVGDTRQVEAKLHHFNQEMLFLSSFKVSNRNDMKGNV
ncbi:unnamed protein product [Lymnaea stagnalis]|uniref:Uncharacterized protein n=1 Tax=Lymnaea stagnalis TaxID=6523 RepID=A0AAV2HJ75_LYMST